MKRIVALAALLAGCVSMSESDCRGADWRGLGEREGRIHGLRPQIDQYTYQCSRHGVQTSEKDYMEGWTDGYREYEKQLLGDS
jgi:hypothetical protein